MEIKVKAEAQRALTREEGITEAKELFAKIDEWFFNTNSTHFDPSYLEHLEETYAAKGFLTKRELEDLRTIFTTWVAN